MATDQTTDTELTAPEMSSIYDENINENDALYEDLPSNILKLANRQEEVHKPKVPLHTRILRTIFSVTVLGLLGVFYNQVGQHIHDNHILVPHLASKPLALGFDILDTLCGGSAPTPLLYAVEGVFLGCLLPFFDKYLFKVKTNNSFGVDSSSILRSGVAFLGIAFAVRRVEWTSSIQAAAAWSFLSPCLWLLLDGTFAGFSMGTLVAAVATTSVVIAEGLPVDCYKNWDFMATMLWLGNFFFFGFIIFGKIGRYLFEQ